MPSAILGVPYSNKAPLFFCSYGDKDNCTESLKSSFTAAGRTTVDHQDGLVSDANSATAFTWPKGKALRAKILSGEKVHPGIEMIIKRTISGWTNSLNETLTFQWVKDGEQADIRISFHNNEPNWSALGVRATLYDESKATMNFAFGGWKENLAVFPQATIARAAAHLFGHAFGLPHAMINWSSPWNKATLDEKYGPFWAELIESSQGSPELQNPQSIMGFDRPAFLGSGTDEPHGGLVIDAESLSLFEKLYPKLFDAYCRHFANSSTRGWTGGIGDIIAKHRNFTTYSANIITGINRLDMGLHGNFRLNSYAEKVVYGGYEVALGCWADTHLGDASCSVLSFRPEDTRIQTGREEYRNWKPEGPSGEDVPGRGLSRRINFSRPWKKVPAVVAFISGFDFANGRNLRIEVKVSNVDKGGFTLDLNTWADSIAYNIQASWLAHEPDDWSIRSGTLESPYFDYSKRAKEFSTKVALSSPMCKRPEYLFHALTFIDVDKSHNLRFQFDASCSESEATAKFLTWEEESRFHCLKGCYIALLYAR